MNLSNETIQKQAVNFLEYQKGRALYHRMQATLDNVIQRGPDAVALEGKVRDLRKQYEIAIELVQGEVSESSCTCGEYDRVIGVCRHRIAALFQYMNGGGKEMEIVRTSPACTMMLTTYEKKPRMVADQEVITGRKVKLVPKLLCDGRKFSAEFRVGYDRTYIIKDLIGFCRGFRQGETAEFGKTCSFENGENAYDAASLKMMRLVNLQLNTYLHHRTAGVPENFAVYGEKIRTLELEETFADDYMEWIAENGVEYQDESGRSCVMKYKEANAVPSVVIKAKGQNGAHITLKSGWKAIFGRKRLYMVGDDTIYACSEDYSRVLQPFYYCMLHQAYPKRGEIDVSERDMPAFLRYVLPHLQKYLPVVFEKIDIEQYAVPVLEASFFLDLLPQGELTLNCEERYGSFSFNPVLTDEVPARILRDREKEVQIHDTLTRYFRYRDHRGMMVMDEDEDLYEFLKTGIDELKMLGTVYMTDAVQRIQVRQAPKIQVGMSFVEDMMQLSFDSNDLSRSELSALLVSYSRKKKYHRLANGDLIRLEGELVEVFDELADGVLADFSGEEAEISLPSWHGMYLDSLLADREMISLSETPDFGKMIEGMRKARPEDCQVPEEMNTVLYDYQKYGFGWMKTLQKYHFGGILADDMGLGKTLQMIALLKNDKGEGRTSLIICPASLVYNWQNELRSFAPELKCLVVSGMAKDREEQLARYQEYDVLVTSYDTVRRDVDSYQNCKFYYEVLDEAQYIKNHTTMNAKAVKLIKSEYRMALTGTPIENRLGELWSIFDFLMPGYLYNYHRFHTLYEQTDEANKNKTGDALKRMVAPFILRRNKKDVLKDLPDKYERVVYSGMEGTQKKLYQAAFWNLKEQLSEKGNPLVKENKIEVLAQLTRLRQICCDPSLCFEDYKGSSAKLETCMELVTRAVDSDHKILLFSQFTSMLSIISKRFTEQGIEHLILTGSTSKEERIELVNCFQTEQIPVFLISLKAGGTGLNLTAADLVIHYDPWWNMAAQNQATDRAHRLGQEKAVTVYRLIAKDTLEESILKLQEQKKQLSEDILSADFTSLASLSKEELLNILSSE